MENKNQFQIEAIDWVLEKLHEQSMKKYSYNDYYGMCHYFTKFLKYKNGDDEYLF